MTVSAKWIPMIVVALGAAGGAVACADDVEVMVAPQDGGTNLPPEQPPAPEDAGVRDAEPDSAKPTEVSPGTCSSSGLCVAAIPVDGTIGLTSVWGSSARDVWAAGSAGTVLHYDGTTWEKTTLVPDDGTVPYTIRSVWSGRSGDVWMADGKWLWHAPSWKGPKETIWSSLAFPSYELPPAAVTGFDNTVLLSRLSPKLRGGSGPWISSYAAWADGGPEVVDEIGMTAYQSLSFTALSASRADEIWAVGSSIDWSNHLKGRVFRAYRGPDEEGVDSWQFEEQLVLTTDVASGVWADSEAIWVVGGHGTTRRMLRSELSNKFFRNVPSPVNVDLHGVFGFAPNDVWMVGAEGTVLHWDGTSLNKVTTPFDDVPSKPRLFSIWGTSPSDLWIVGQGTVLHLQKGAP
ncbi:Type IV fimbrial biogenesis protein PilY1 [Labilithrix luteola]|uniref:Type IV fimbrial biogenesis protein PilY1 n=1 Tax=Labilithrix luteola TaxID=1391654 RepID=A0A0K1PPS6_9BACT|nr:hypothetical protein [Labilithrix luteola]AKU95528.1 Type IV fimbrial biogenesis protein PilY1 [Labilithrix luteola]